MLLASSFQRISLFVNPEHENGQGKETVKKYPQQLVNHTVKENLMNKTSITTNRSTDTRYETASITMKCYPNITMGFHTSPLPLFKGKVVQKKCLLTYTHASKSVETLDRFIHIFHRQDLFLGIV